MAVAVDADHALVTVPRGHLLLLERVYRLATAHLIAPYLDAHRDALSEAVTELEAFKKAHYS